MVARIFKPSKTAMQSGMGGTRDWILEYEPEIAREIDPLMGWTSSSDMNAQVILSFGSADEAVAYAERNGIAYNIQEPKKTTHRPRAYSDNFKYGRPDRWTH